MLNLNATYEFLKPKRLFAQTFVVVSNMQGEGIHNVVKTFTQSLFMLLK